MEELEQDAAIKGIGPRRPCTMISNFNSNKVNCGQSHNISQVNDNAYRRNQ